jgi:prephenate dehydratase/chorismate mutase/prephenate dehydratase
VEDSGVRQGDLRGRRVAFQGERGAFTEEAALAYFGDSVELVPMRTLREAFSAVEGGGADYAVIPIENTLAGSVGEAYDLLLEHELRVYGEVILRVEHHLLSVEGATLEGIREVWSHPQAIDQCRRFLESLGANVVPMWNTAAAAKRLAEVRDARVAVIASRRAAEIYGLRILASNVEDDSNNYTRFFVLSKESRPPTGDDLTSIIFSTRHEPGALYRCLEPFAERRINLTKIESRPVRSRPWEYNFYVDIVGHVRDPVVSEALDALSRRATFVRVLGSYPKWRPRDAGRGQGGAGQGG